MIKAAVDGLYNKERTLILGHSITVVIREIGDSARLVIGIWGINML